jgi:alpha-mannosidase
MHSSTARLHDRLKRFLSERLAPALYRRVEPLTITAWEVPDEPVPFAEAIRAEYSPISPGTAWGRPWGTVWFHVTGTLPENWADSGSPGDAGNTTGAKDTELLVDLGFSLRTPGFQAEALVYSPDGQILKAIEPRNRYVPLDIRPGGPIDVFIEAAANPDIGAKEDPFAPTVYGDKATAGSDPLYVVRQMAVALLDRPVWELGQDIAVLHGLWQELNSDTPRCAEIGEALSRMLDIVDPQDVSGTAAQGRELLADVLSRPANASAHRIIATGHAHIDSAWLWPVRETVRKCARTFSNVLSLMDEYPELTFACSSAQQYAWIKKSYPDLFERIRAKVATGQFVPVGGMWVEPDTNMPGGEAMARQFVAGKRFFLEEFGIEPEEVWLPDSFGYSGALPQIALAAGARWFLTQKISWNDTNTMPHHTFQWEGIDGSRIFTHFPPVDTYNSTLSAEDLARAERQFAEKGRANTSLVPFGYGDGGGGPTREMLAAARRSANLEGSPRVTVASPRVFFETAEAEYLDPPVWSGELYLELHRGTYTSQARTKRGNRRSESLLREAELWATTATVDTGLEYPYAELEELWHIVLLQQFHDILPGSAIAWVHREAERQYELVRERLEAVIGGSVDVLAGPGERTIALNAGPLPQDGVTGLGGGVRRIPKPSVKVECTGGVHVIANEHLRLTVDPSGLFSSIVDLDAGREVVAPGARANLLQLHQDIPNRWDAWDIDAHYRDLVEDLTGTEAVDIVEESGERVRLRIARRFGASRIEQLVTVEAGTRSIRIDHIVDWHERQKLLKLSFPVAVHADEAASETQFGYVKRPTFANTSWDVARYETCAHRWVHVGEPGYGVAVANDSTYGHDITRIVLPDGGVGTQIRLSLLRAPLFPDPESDQGEHRFSVSLRIGALVGDAIDEGYRLNLPLREVTGGRDIDPLIEVSDPAVVVESVKLAEDRSGDLVVRLYESLGGRATARLHVRFAHDGAAATDLLERPLPGGAPGIHPVEKDVELTLRPFQIVTLRFRRSTNTNQECAPIG